MEYRLRRLVTVLLVLFGINAQLAAAPIVLYDDSLGNLPADQTWLLFGADGAATQTPVPGTGVNLVTNDPVSAGYSNYVPFFNVFKNLAFPVLDRSSGFRLQFELQVNSESHSMMNPNRAGFSVILLASDMLGIELGFWETEIWAQSGPSFTHAEGINFDTTAQEVIYELTILGSSYSLAANGTTILSNALRDYSAFGLPYSLPSYLFLGDDTSSAAADITLGQVTLDIEIPLPSSLLLLLAGLLALISAGRRRCRRSPARIPLLRPRSP